VNFSKENLFDRWAKKYDRDVFESDHKNEYPFAGYSKVLSFIWDRVNPKNDAKILDLGVGAGVLSSMLYEAGSRITALDCSSNMLTAAKEKMPDATFIQWDFSNGLPERLLEQAGYYDYVISTYALHHLNEEKQIEILLSLATLLKPQGTVFIGDISFEKRVNLETCRKHYQSLWDDEEFYIVAEEIINVLSHVYECTYDQISYCAGVFTLKPLLLPLKPS